MSIRIERDDLDALFAALLRRGFRVVGPTRRGNAIVYDTLSSAADLPIGWGDEQDAGTYRLKRRGDEALFGYNLGPHAWKQFLFPPRDKLWGATKTEDGFRLDPETGAQERYAFIGVRACELHAIQVQDAVFATNNPHYRRRRENALIVAVNCGQAARTCFCGSMNTGPSVAAGYDIVLTEIIDGARHGFLADAGTEAGRAVLADVPGEAASEADQEAAAASVEKARADLVRHLDTAGIKDLLYRNYDTPHWDTVAQRCLSCANCTMVCPTCFCTTVEDTTDLTGEHAERWQTWDSCFTGDFSYIHGGSVRPAVRSRYRQWMTHKLAAWHDQFDSSGCVGCGRCIAWCPVGIDITEETAAIRNSERETSHGVD